MGKKLPKIFPGKVTQNSGNNKKVFYSTKEEKMNKEEKPKQNINQKLRQIFNSSNYVYKANVKITLENGSVIKQIIGKNKNHLITIENELIPIKEIKDIEIVKKQG